MKVLAISVFISLLLVSACAQKTTPIELCETTISDYAKYRDNPETADLYANLFADDGSFTLGPNTTTGRDALSARHTGSHGSATWGHEMGTTKVTDNNGAISGVSSVTVKTSPKNDLKTTRTITADYIDTFEIVSGTCLIKSRSVKLVSDETVTEN